MFYRYVKGEKTYYHFYIEGKQLLTPDLYSFGVFHVQWWVLSHIPPHQNPPPKLGFPLGASDWTVDNKAVGSSAGSVIRLCCSWEEGKRHP